MAVEVELNREYEIKNDQRVNILATGGAPTIEVSQDGGATFQAVNDVTDADNVFDFGACLIRFSAIPGTATFTISNARS